MKGPQKFFLIQTRFPPLYKGNDSISIGLTQNWKDAQYTWIYGFYGPIQWPNDNKKWIVVGTGADELMGMQAEEV